MYNVYFQLLLSVWKRETLIFIILSFLLHLPPSPSVLFLAVIGDEILKGHVQDVNSHYLCHQLWLLGVKVCKVINSFSAQSYLFLLRPRKKKILYETLLLVVVM